MRLSELTEGGLDTEAPGTYPLDKIIDQVIEEPRIKALLNPLPLAKGGSNKRESESQAMFDLKMDNKRLKTRATMTRQTRTKATKPKITQHTLFEFDKATQSKACNPKHKSDTQTQYDRKTHKPT